MKIAVLGAGLQGSACVYDLLQNPDITGVGLADESHARAEAVARKMQHLLPATDGKLSVTTLDVTSHDALVAFLQPYDAVISAVPYFLNLGITHAAIDSGTHLVDMGGNTDLVWQQRKLDEKARAAGVTVLPDCGLAPGMANIIAAHGIAQFDGPVDSVRIRVGGLPQFPKPPLDYQLFFSIHGLINEYVGKAVVLKNGQVEEVDTLTDLETLTFEGREYEAFNTLGGLSTLPWTYQGRVRDINYKTIRYPGHCHQIKTMNDLGLFGDMPVEVDGALVRPRDVFAAVAVPRLTFEDNRDMVLVLVALTGQRQGEPVELTYRITDRYDEVTDLTAMMRTTAFPVSIVAQMMADGTIAQRGVLPLETAVPTDRFMAELPKRRITVEETLNRLVGG